MTATEINKPMLDIILPVYNTERYVDQCIKSIVNQEFKDWHLIILDDGSTDSSSVICDNWAKRDQRITVIHKTNSGQADSRNIGIKMCTAEYVGFVDSDDKIEPNMYSLLIENLQKNEADISMCNYYSYTTMGSVCKHHNVNIEVFSNNQAMELLIKDEIQSCMCMMVFKRSCIAYPIPRNICFEDYAVMPHWFERARCVVRDMRPLYHYRKRRSSIVHTLTLQRELDFLEAEKQRFEYFRNSKYMPLATLCLMVRCIIVAKCIAFLNIDRKEMANNIENIKHILVELAPGYVSKLKLKDMLVYWSLMLNTSIFINFMKMIKLFNLNKKVDDRYLFD